VTATSAALWRHGPFRWVVSGETLSLVGDSSFQIVLAWLVLTISGSPATLAGVLVAAAIPRGVLMLVGGAVTDRWSPRTVMLVCHLARAVAMVMLTVSAATDALRTWQFLVVGIGLGVADAFFWPASGSIVPSLVSPAQLPRANAVTAVGEQVGGLVGPVVGGFLLAATTPTVALAFNSMTFAVAAATVATAPARTRAADPDPRPEPVRELVRDLRAGVAHAAADPRVRVVLLLVSAATLSYSGLFAVGLPALARRYPNGSVVLGLLVSAWGLGQLTGALLASITGLPRRWGLLIITMTICEGTAFAVLGLAPSYLLAVALLAVLGVGVAYSTDVALPTFIQSQTPRQLLGRVNSVLNLPRVALEPVSIAGMGLLAGVDLRLTFAAAALPMLLVGIRLALSPTARRLQTPRLDDRHPRSEPYVSPYQGNATPLAPVSPEPSDDDVPE
jgi:MFS family permease